MFENRGVPERDPLYPCCFSHVLFNIEDISDELKQTSPGDMV